MELCILCLPCDPCDPCNSGIVSIGITTLYVLVIAFIITCVLLLFIKFASCLYHNLFPKQRCLEKRMNVHNKLISQFMDIMSCTPHENSYRYSLETIVGILGKIIRLRDFAKDRLTHDEQELRESLERIEEFIEKAREIIQQLENGSTLSKDLEIDKVENDCKSVKKKYVRLTEDTLTYINNTCKEIQESIESIKKVIPNEQTTK